MIREDIIHEIGSFPIDGYGDILNQLLSCFEFKDDPTYERLKIQIWLQGCIESLFYRPNKYCLILCGSNEYSEFFHYLSPKKKWVGFTGSINQAQDMSHDFLFMCVQEELSYYSKVKQMRSLCYSTEFVVSEGEFPECDKRIASYCATVTEWKHPVAKSDLVIHLLDFDWQMFNSIDKHLLWSELFHKYKIR